MRPSFHKRSWPIIGFRAYRAPLLPKTDIDGPKYYICFIYICLMLKPFGETS